MFLGLCIVLSLQNVLKISKILRLGVFIKNCSYKKESRNTFIQIHGTLFRQSRITTSRLFRLTIGAAYTSSNIYSLSNHSFEVMDLPTSLRNALNKKYLIFVYFVKKVWFCSSSTPPWFWQKSLNSGIFYPFS